MTTEAEGVDSPTAEDNEQAAADAAKLEELATKSLEDQLAALKAINADAIKTRDSAKRKLREIEKSNEKTAAEAASYKERLISRAVTESLKTALVDAGVLSVDTALKLIDKKAVLLNDEFEADPESIKTIVTALSVSDSILFKAKAEEKAEDEKEKVLPNNPIKRPGSKTTQEDAFTIALRGAKSQREIEALLKLHGKM